jgi:hypothetical protein
MDNLQVALRAAGAQLTDMVRTTVYVASTVEADLVTAWDIARARFGDHDAPSTLLGVTVLGYQGQLVESKRSPWLAEPALGRRRRARTGGALRRSARPAVLD